MLGAMFSSGIGNMQNPLSYTSLAFFLLAVSGAPAGACSLTMGWEAYEPFQMQSGTTVTGLDVDLFQEVAKQAGCAVVPREVPWKRLLSDMEAGRMDAAIGASLTPDREAYARFSKPYRQDEFVLFMRKGDTARLGKGGIAEASTNGARLGIVGGYEYGDAFKALQANPAFAKLLQEASETKLNLRKLLANRIDAFIENRFVGLALARQEGAFDKIEVHPVPVSSDAVHFMFGRKSVTEATALSFDAALEAMRNDGRYDKVVARYLN